MKRTLTSISMAALLLAASAHAQLYKSVGPDGKVTYSDMPPVTAGKVEKKIDAGGNRSDTAGNLPYELAQVVKTSPVTLYTTVSCPACDEGRKLLTARGIPFSEKTVRSNEDIERLKQAGGDTQLPFLVIGRTRQRGFEPNGWHASLAAAGYPETSKLPKSYRAPPAEPAAPIPVETPPQPKPEQADTPPTPAAPAEALPRPAGNAPPGFKF